MALVLPQRCISELLSLHLLLCIRLGGLALLHSKPLFICNSSLFHLDAGLLLSVLYLSGRLLLNVCHGLGGLRPEEVFPLPGAVHYGFGLCSHVLCFHTRRVQCVHRLRDDLWVLGCHSHLHILLQQVYVIVYEVLMVVCLKLSVILRHEYRRLAVHFQVGIMWCCDKVLLRS